jgi:hypothetical protein
MREDKCHCPFCGAADEDGFLYGYWYECQTTRYTSGRNGSLIYDRAGKCYEAELAQLRGLLTDLVEDEQKYEPEENESAPAYCNFCGRRAVNWESIKHTANCAVDYAEAYLDRVKKEG